MKKYSEKFLKDYNILSKAVIGLEFEFFLKELSYYKTLEILNSELEPIKCHGFRQYHPDFKPDAENWLLTPDLSGGQNMVEVVTGPLPYFDAKHYLIRILKFIQKYGFTTEKSSIHFNISFPDNEEKNLNDLNILKLILTTDEDEIYRVFPSRQNNVYAKSIKKLIPFKDYDFENIPIGVVKNNFRLPNDKYYGINFLHINKLREGQRLEFRYIGGKGYEAETANLLYFLDRFILNVYSSINANFDEADIEKLEQYLKKNISLFKTFSKYDNFLVEHPEISLQIDQITDFDVVSTYFDKIYKKIFELLENTNNLTNCILNYVTQTQRLEIVDAEVRSNHNLENIDFINCKIYNGIFNKCQIINSEAENSQFIKCDIDGSQIHKSKVLNSNVEASLLQDCFFMGGYLNSEMEAGIFRSGKLGPYANVSSNTKVVSEYDNFFDTSFDSEDLENKENKKIMSFKK
jgi:uncharacterized protein YjbI with pentapeptide repeats